MSTPPVAVSSRLRASSSNSSRRIRSSQFGLLATRLREFTNKLGDSCFESDVGLFHAEAPTPLRHSRYVQRSSQRHTSSLRALAHLSRFQRPARGQGHSSENASSEKHGDRGGRTLLWCKSLELPSSRYPVPRRRPAPASVPKERLNGGCLVHTRQRGFCPRSVANMSF